MFSQSQYLLLPDVLVNGRHMQSFELIKYLQLYQSSCPKGLVISGLFENE